MKKALITGITGQDGSYLAEFLLEKGYEVHGLIRRSSISNTGRIDHLIRENKIVLHGGDLSDSSSLVRIIGEVRPDEIYNLGAQSHVQVSFEAPEYAGDVDALGVLRILEAVRIVGGCAPVRPQGHLPHLSGIYFRTVRKSGRSAAEREYTVPSLQPLCGGKTVRLLDREGIPGCIQYVRSEWYPV